MRPNARGKRRRSTAGAQGTNTGHENAEGMACVGVRLTAQLGAGDIGRDSRMSALPTLHLFFDEVVHQVGEVRGRGFTEMKRHLEAEGLKN